MPIKAHTILDKIQCSLLNYQTGVCSTNSTLVGCAEFILCKTKPIFFGIYFLCFHIFFAFLSKEQEANIDPKRGCAQDIFHIGP